MSKLTGKPKKRLALEILEEEKDANKRHQAPGRSVESREAKLIAKAYDLVEKRIDRGTATSQETTHFLKIGSSFAELEKVKLERENQLLIAKTEALVSQKEIKELFEKAMKAFGIYRGEEIVDNETED